MSSCNHSMTSRSRRAYVRQNGSPCPRCSRALITGRGPPVARSRTFRSARRSWSRRCCRACAISCSSVPRVNPLPFVASSVIPVAPPRPADRMRRKRSGNVGPRHALTYRRAVARVIGIRFAVLSKSLVPKRAIHARTVGYQSPSCSSRRIVSALPVRTCSSDPLVWRDSSVALARSPDGCTPRTAETPACAGDRASRCAVRS